MQHTVYLKTVPNSWRRLQILNSLTDKQRKWISQYTYRIDYNPATNQTVLNIRTDTEQINYTELLFLFPEATIGPAVTK